MRRTETLTVDLKVKNYNQIRLKQLDTTELVFKVLDNSNSIDLKNKTAQIIFTRPDRRIVMQDCTVSSSENKISIVLSENCVRVPGLAKIELVVKETNETISSFYINAFIEKTSKEDIKADDTKLYIEEFEEKLNEMDQRADTRLEEKLTEIEKNANGDLKNYAEEYIEEYVNETIQDLKEECDRLREDINNTVPYVEGAGEDIILQNTANARFRKFEFSGKGYQEESEQGKNVLDSSFSEFNQNGITATYNKDTQEITINGTCDSTSSNIRFKNFKPISRKYNQHIYMKIKYISGSCTGNEINCNFAVADSDYSMVFNIPLNGISEDIAQDNIAWKDITFSTSYIRINEGDTFDNLKFKVMLSTSDVEYEPFIPNMPSIEYQSDVKACGDNVNVAKINEDDWELTANNTIKNKSKNENKVLTELSVKAGQTVNFKLKLISKPTASTTFTFRVDNVVTDSYNFLKFDKFNLNQIYTKKYTAEKDCTLKYTCYGNANNEKFEFQFWASIDSSSVSYSKYGQGNINIKVQNKNIAYDCRYMSRTSKYSCCIYASYFVKKDKYYVISFDTPTSNARLYLQSSSYGTKFKMVPILKDVSCDGKRQKFVVQAIETGLANNVTLVNLRNTVTEGVLLSNLMIEEVEDENGINTENIPHEEQAFPIPTQSPMFDGDYFDTKNNEEVHYWNSYTFTGDEGWSKATEGNMYYLVKNTTPNYNINDLRVISDCAIGIVNDEITSANTAYYKMKNNEVALRNHETKAIYFRFDDIETLDDFKTKIKGKKIYYITETPTRLELTEEQSKILNKLEKTIHSYKEITNIISEDEVSPVFEVEAPVNIQSQNDNLQKQIDEIKELLSATQTSAMLVENLEKDLEREVMGYDS